MRGVLLMLILGCWVPAQATSLRVPGDVPTILGALAASPPCDTIWVDPGRYEEHLDIPDRNLILLSRYAQTADSQDILDTILDGTNTGTLIKVRSHGHNRLVVQGFTLTGGWASRNGSADMDDFTGGAVHLEPRSRVVLKDCLFTGNNGEYNASGYCIFSGRTGQIGERIFPQSVRLDHCCFSQNINATAPVFYGKNVLAPVDSVYLEDLTFLNNAVDSGNAFAMPANIYSYANRVKVSGLRNTMVDQHGVAPNIFGLGGYSHTEARRLRLENCTIRGNAMFSFISADSLIMDDVTVRGNRLLRTENSNAVFSASGTWFDARNLLVMENVAAYGPILALGTEPHPVDQYYQLGKLENLMYWDNTVGDTISVATTGGYQHASISHLSVRNCRFERNTSAWAGLLTDEGCACHDIFRFSPPFNPAEYQDQVIEDCLFQDNWVLDGDDYPAILARPGVDVWPEPNRGRAFSFVSGPYANLTLRRCVFRNNKQPNIAPEWKTEYWNPLVGSTVAVGELGFSEPDNDNFLLMEDCLLEGNDDGNLHVSTQGAIQHVEIRNVIIHGGRSGLVAGSPHLRIHNVLIDSVRQQLSWPDPDFSYTHAIWGGSDGDGLVSNATIVNCDVPSLIDGFGYLDVPPTRFRNILCANNTYTQLMSTRWQPQTLLEYSCLQEPWEGTGNFVAAPGFAQESQIPYLLAADSPCVDAGDPDPSWTDPEDPQNPGWAAWPAQGTVRADVGWLGGPGVPALVDWVDVPALPEHPATRPQRARLGQPYPNPFNPVTRIPLTLIRHSLVKLSVHNLLGQEVAVLQNGVLAAGDYAFTWDAAGLASGVYVISLGINLDTVQSRTVTLLR